LVINRGSINEFLLEDFLITLIPLLPLFTVFVLAKQPNFQKIKSIKVNALNLIGKLINDHYKTNERNIFLLCIAHILTAVSSQGVGSGEVGA